MKNPLVLAFQRTIQKGIFSFLCFLLFTSIGFTQSKQELERIRFEIIKEIDATNKLLSETERNKKAVLSDLQVINSQIDNRRKLVNQINKEIALLNQEIIDKEYNIATAQVTVDSLKRQYGLMLRAMYKEKLTRNPIIEFFSDNLWKSIILRNSYYLQLKQYLDQKLYQIESVQEELLEEVNLLNDEKLQKMNYQEEVAAQNGLLENELNRQKTLMASLQEDEVALKDALEIQRGERERMNVAIENIINSRFGQEENLSSEGNMVFSSMKGMMPWPVQGGVISSKYGKQPHPTLKNITISNNGIDIRALIGSNVQAVAPGKVVGVTDLAGYGKMIIIKHNQYFTVYSKLKDVFVQNGDNIELGAELGTLLLKNDVSELHFEIWNNNKSENPENWLNK